MRHHPLLTTLVSIQTFAIAWLSPDDRDRPALRRARGDEGQATTEYALVLIAAAMVALLVIAWATAGGGAAKIGELFNSVIDKVIGEV